MLTTRWRITNKFSASKIERDFSC